jgi:RNA polymerase sigma factor (sigma-70 family)
LTNQELVEKYQPYLYNLALRLVYYKEDANDLVNDVWIKIIENIESFEEKSDFKTWSYRIMINHFLNQQRKTTELNFNDFENTMNSMKDCLLGDEYDEAEKKLLINEAKVGCMMGMLLCLGSEQRAILVIGDIFEIKSDTASQIFGIAKENFRKKLSRARADLYSFMNNHCSLVNKKNSCKCEQKTKELIKQDYVNPNDLQFNPIIQKSIKDKLQILSDNLDNTMEDIYKELYQQHPFCKVDEKEFATNILKNKEIQKIFQL